MTLAELTSKVQYVTDAEGNRQAVVLEMAVWEEVVNALEQLEPTQPQKQSKGRKRLMKQVADSRQAYESGQVRRGTANDLIAELTA